MEYNLEPDTKVDKDYPFIFKVIFTEREMLLAAKTF
jgi:hypothetical protein